MCLLFINNRRYMQQKFSNKRCAPHLRLVPLIFSIGSIDKTTIVCFYNVSNSCINLEKIITYNLVIINPLIFNQVWKRYSHMVLLVHFFFIIIFFQPQGQCLRRAPIDPIQHYVAKTLCVHLQTYFSYFYITQTNIVMRKVLGSNSLCVD